MCCAAALMPCWLVARPPPPHSFPSPSPSPSCPPCEPSAPNPPPPLPPRGRALGCPPGKGEVRFGKNTVRRVVSVRQWCVRVRAPLPAPFCQCCALTPTRGCSVDGPPLRLRVVHDRLGGMRPGEGCAVVHSRGRVRNRCVSDVERTAVALRDWQGPVLCTLGCWLIAGLRGIPPPLSPSDDRGARHHHFRRSEGACVGLPTAAPSRSFVQPDCVAQSNAPACRRYPRPRLVTWPVCVGHRDPSHAPPPCIVHAVEFHRGLCDARPWQARLALARAVYSRADTVLLDDALSALDSVTARHIYGRVIGKQGLLKDSAVVLVTHAVR
jgi:hypothetical protein